MYNGTGSLVSRPLLPSPSRVRLKEYCSLLLGSSPLFLHLSHSSPSWYILYFLSRPVQHVPRYGYIHIWLCPYMVIPIIILGLNLSPIHRMSHAQFEWDCKISPPACACMYVSNKSAPDCSPISIGRGALPWTTSRLFHCYFWVALMDMPRFTSSVRG